MGCTFAVPCSVALLLRDLSLWVTGVYLCYFGIASSSQILDPYLNSTIVLFDKAIEIFTMHSSYNQGFITSVNFCLT